MNKIFLKLLTLFLITITPVFASQKVTDDVARISAVSLYNINKNSLQATIKEYINKYPNLKALKIVESLSNETYISLYKLKGEIFYEKKIPESIEKLLYFKSIAKYNGEETGVIHAYFDKIINNKKELNIAFHFDRPPFMFGKTSSKGIEADIIKEIMASKGYKVNVHQMARYNIEAISKDNKKFDGVSSVPDTNDGMYYTDHFISYQNYAITRKKDNIQINSIKDLTKVKFVAWDKSYRDLGDEYYEYFNPKNGKFQTAYYDETSQENQHKFFFDKNVDAIVVDKTIFEWYKLALKNKEKYTFHKIFPKATTYPAKFKSKKVRDDFNKGLQELKQNGRYDDIIKFYTTQDIRPLLKYSNLIADISSHFLFSHKPNELKKILQYFFQHSDILHIEIFDNAGNKNFLNLHKKIQTKENKKELHSPSIIKKIYYTDGGNPLNVGQVKIFYDKKLNLNQGSLVPPISIFTDFNDKELTIIENAYKKFGYKTSKIHFTKEEQQWININTIKVGVEQWAPVIFSNTGKDIDGISGDILKLVVEKTGLKIKIINNLWDPLLEDFKNEKIDLLPATYYTKRRATYGLYSSGYYKMLDYIYVKEDNSSIYSMKDLNGKTLAIQKGFGSIPKVKNKFPNINIIETKDLKDSITKVLNGKVDALYDGQFTVEYKMQDELITGLKGIAQNDFDAAKLHFFSHNNKPILKSILQKGLDSITFEERKNIVNKWIGLDNDLKLSKKEQKWLNKKIPIRYIYDPDWAPFEWTNELAKHTGMLSDILSIVSQKSGIEFIPVGVNKWSDAVQKAKQKEVDMYSGINQTAEKSTYMNFTQKSIYQTPYVFVTRLNDTSDYFETFNALKNKKVGVVDGYSIHDTLKKEKPELHLVPIGSTKKAFEKLQDKSIDVFVVNAASAKYYINRLGFDNLRIATKTSYNLDLKIAIRKDWPSQPISILDKALNSITEKDLSDIYYKWTEVTVEEKTNWTLIFQITGIGFLIIGFVVYTNRKLKRKVSEKTLELTTLLSSFDENVIASKTDLKGRITYVSKAFCEITEYSQEELIGKPQNIIRHPDMKKEIFQDLWKTIKSLKTWKGEIKNKKKGGDFYWVEAVIEPIFDLTGKPIGYSGIRQDITSKKEAEDLTKKQTEQLNEIQRFQALTVGRESRMIELKELINTLSNQLNQSLPFDMNMKDDTLIESVQEDEELNINDVVDISSLQNLLDNFCNSIEIASAIIDLKGNVLAASRWQKACTHFHRVNESSCSNCIESDTGLSLKLEDGEEYSIYKCKNGLVDCASPIIINGKHIANVFIGQFLIQKPDLLFFTEQSKQYDYDQSSYLEAISEVPIIDEDKLPFILKFLSEFTKMITSLSMEKLKADKADKVNKKVKLAAINLAEDANLAKSELLKHQEHLEELIVERTKEISQNKLFVDALLDSQEQIVITTDGKILRSCNEAFLKYFDLENMEEFTKDYDCICDRFECDETNTYLQKYMGELSWIEYVLEHDKVSHKAVIEKDGFDRIFTVTAAIMPIEDGTIMSAVFTDITELEIQKKQTESILSSVLLPMLITSKTTRKIVYANSFAERQYESTLDEIIGSDIDIFYTSEQQKDKILKEMKDKGTVENFETRFKTFKDNEFEAILSLIDITYGGEECFLGVASDISEQKERESVMQKLHKNVTDSIDYASLIQHALVPEKSMFDKYFNDYFTIWHPKDVVGGDIYLFEELRNENECLLMVIDCTGHGVPGAFVTMLVKAIERQVISDILSSNDEVSPAYILSYFNKTMKKLLKQENDQSISNAGFDGGILYYNKSKNLIRYAGAETPLFYIQNDELNVIKSDRHSIGYKKSDANHKFTDHELHIDTKTKIYITTDGYLDQNGGNKGFPYGKRKFHKLIHANHKEKFSEQKELLLYEMQDYQKEEEKNDDVTIIGLSINPNND